MTIKTLDRSSSQVLPTNETQVALRRQHTRPDPDIAADVQRVLREDAILRAIGDRIEARVNAGDVYLSSYVPTRSHKVRAEIDVRQVPGIRQVKNHLIADPDLEVMVAQQLTRDARLCGYTIFAHSTDGVVRLDGQMDRADLADAAERCAASVPYVRAVVNCIQLPGAANRQPERVLLPRIGQAVYASDGWLGQTIRVVLNPNNRRVTAIAIDAHFYRDSLATERLVLIPITTGRNVNASGVELGITISEADHCADFDPTRFVVPDPDWQPPLDYVPSDIVLEPADNVINRTDRR